MAGNSINIAMIGHGFMGRAHSNAFTQVSRFFDPPVRPVQHTVFGRDETRVGAFASRWGWQHTSTNWKKTIASDEIDLVDVVVPTANHRGPVEAAIAAGKWLMCEKPLAGTLAEAREMLQIARQAKARTFVGYNYRRVPAVSFAHQLVKQGKLGQIRHVRAFFLQDWADESIPLIWRFDKKRAGSGSHGDLGAHAIDMVRFVTGEEITEICGAISETFVKERHLQVGGAAGGIAAGMKGTKARKGKVKVDDAVLFLARFSGGAVAHFEATRMATGNQNKLGFEINGTKGAVRFNFERMNELEFYDCSDERPVQGWHTIICTHGGAHPYAEAYWPDAHVIGYEHSFINHTFDILRIVAGQKPLVPLPDFEDAYQTQRVLEAAMLSAQNRCWIKMSQVR